MWFTICATRDTVNRICCFCGKGGNPEERRTEDPCTARIAWPWQLSDTKNS